MLVWINLISDFLYGLSENILKSLLIITANDTTKQIKPANETVVNFGVSFLHLKLTEKTENPTADTIPKTKPINVVKSVCQAWMAITGPHLAKLSIIADGAGKTNLGMANIKTQASHKSKVEATINHGPNLLMYLSILAFTFPYNFFAV